MNNPEQPNMGGNQAENPIISPQNPSVTNSQPQYSSFPSQDPSQTSGQTQYSSPQYQTSGQAQYAQPQYQFQPQYAQPGAAFGQPPLQPNYGQPYYPPTPTTSNSPLMDFLTFRLMVTPIIIQVVFWLGIIGIVLSALAQFTSRSPLVGLLTLVIGPLLWRVLCELYILLFRIHNSLSDIKNDLRQRR